MTTVVTRPKKGLGEFCLSPEASLACSALGLSRFRISWRKKHINAVEVDVAMVVADRHPAIEGAWRQKNV